MNPLLAVGVVAVVACLLLIIFLFLSLKSGDILPPTAQTVPSEQATLPAEAPTTTANENLTRQHDYATGDTVQLYAHDLIAVPDAKNPNRSYRVLAAEFMDSRCPTGRTCIWAGERAVLLTVTDLIADKTEDLRLGQRITPSGEVMGLRCTLLGFSDATGTYAEIKFE